MPDTTDPDARASRASDAAPRAGRRRPIAWLAATVAILVLVVVGVAGAAFGRSTRGADASGTITVTGSSTVEGTPDTLSFNVGVDTVESTAAASLQANDDRMRSLEATLERAGVPAKDLQTSDLSIYQRTNSDGVVTGWEVDDSLNVTVHDLARAGAIIDAAAQVAGNDISFGGVSFSISNDSAELATARRDAMQDARTEASQLAAGGGAAVAGILKVTDLENTSVSTPLPFYGVLNAASAGVPLQRGQEPVTVQVTVTYSLSS